MSVETDSTKNMTREAKRDYPDIVTPSASLAPSLSTAPLWQQLLLSQAVAQNSAAVLGALPGNDSLRHAHKLHAEGAQSSGAESQLTGLRLQPSAFQSYSQQSAAQALLQLPYQGLNSSAPAHASHAHANNAQLATARTASATLLSHAPSTDANSCGAGDDSGLCGDPNACKRKRNLKQQELNKLAQQRYRERKKERDAELRQVLEGQTARMVELLDNHQKLQARVKELEHQLREKQVENVYLRGQITGLQSNGTQQTQQGAMSQHDEGNTR